MSAARMRGRLGRQGCWAALIVVALLTWATVAVAREGDSRAGLFIGTTTFAVDGYNTFGTTFGGSYGYEFQTDLLWTVGGAFSSTDARVIVDPGTGPQQVTLQAKTAAFQTGLLAYFNRSELGVIVPFAGGGLSFINYDLKYPYTNVGTTSGTGPGAYGDVGVELRLTENVTLIPQIGLQVHNIKTQSGATKGLLSGGLVFTIRISS